MRILIAEDDRITRASLVRQLAAWKHEVAEAPDGESAWGLFQAFPYDLVITDWEMPRLSGLELIQRIRQVDRPEYVYIIMLTSRSDKSDVVKGIEAGADDFVSKPFDREELRVRLLAGDRIVRLEHALSRQNVELREAGERMRSDLEAAAQVQRAMLPRQNIVTAQARTAWAYEPTDQLAGDALGLHLIDERYLAAYVIDVSGHGVPAALLSVTAMHYLEPEPENASLLRDLARGGGMGSVQRPSVVAAELNRRFSADNSDNRFLTMILGVLDTFDGRLLAASAGHPLPIVLRGQEVVPVADAGGLPIALFDSAKYADLTVQLEPGDRVYLFSDGIVEQAGSAGRDAMFGQDRLVDLLLADHAKSLDQVVAHGIDALADWAGGRQFADDVSLVALEWIKPAVGSEPR
jgi:sigma-B regulation protein RsbU (phosphoserine phosphatase)